MDLNYLLHRQQVERSRADTASCEEAREAHAQLAALYEDAIQTLTRGNLSFLEPAGSNAEARLVKRASPPHRSLCGKRSQDSRRSASARSRSELMLKNGSRGFAGHSTAT